MSFIKLISLEAIVGYNEPAKIQCISKVFNDSYKSPNSLIVVDNIERLPSIYTPHLRDLSNIPKSVNAFDDKTRHKVINELETMTQGQDVKVGIKKILSILETSRQDEDVGHRFIDLMANSIAESIGGEP